jgi:hypothetical protein
VREGFHADGLLVDGDRVAELSVLQHKHLLVGSSTAASSRLGRAAFERRDASAAA